MDPAASFAMPTGDSSSSFDLSEVDFDYVEKLTKRDSKKLRGIIIALEQERAYPDLLKAAQEKLKQIDPKSVPPTFGAASPTEKNDALADLLEWSAAAKSKDASLRSARVPAARGPSVPIRGHVESAFAVDPSAASAKPAGLDLGQELNTSKLLPAEVAIAAVAEKEKGNECFRAREYNDAVKFYTRSLHLVPNDATTLNNRAITFIKQKAWDSALNDVSLVLQSDPRNWKALWRRGQVFEGKLFLERALDDFKLASTAFSELPENQGKEQAELKKSIKKVEQSLLEQQPNHPYVAHLRKAPASTKPPAEEKESQEPAPAPTAAPAAKPFKRMQIAEVEDDDDEEEDDDEGHDAGAKVPDLEDAPPVAAPVAAAPAAMKRMPIQEVDDDDEEDDEEIVASTPIVSSPAPAAPVTASPTPVVAPAPVASAPKPAPKKEKSKPAPAFHSKNGGMMIEVVSDEEEDEDDEPEQAAVPQPAAAAAAASPAAPAASAVEPTLPPIPASCVSFERDWSELKSHSSARDLQFAYLRRIDPQSVSTIFAPTRGGSLTTTTFSALLSVVVSHYLPADAPRALALLTELAKTDRFALNAGMAEPKVKRELREALQTRLNQATDDTERAQVQHIVKKYA